MMAALSPEERAQAEKFAADMLAGMGMSAEDAAALASLNDDDSFSIPATETIVDENPPTEDTVSLPETAPARKGRAPGGRDAKLLAGIQGIYYLVGTMLVFVNQKDAQIVIAGAPDRAAELLAVANHHPEFKKWLVRFTQSNDYLSLILGHGLMAMAIMSNHKMVPDSIAKNLPLIEGFMKQAREL